MQRNNFVRADLHNHFKTKSDFNNGDFNKYIDVVRDKLGERGVVGLVNFGDNRYEEFTELKGYDRENLNCGFYVPEKKVLVIKGQEIATKQGHLLVLGFEENVNLADGKELQYSLKEAKERGGIIIADHPFYLKGIGKEFDKNPELLPHFDAIETFNGEAMFGNKKAREFYECVYANYPNLSWIASSDGHSPYEIGRNWIEIEKLNMFNLRESLRERIKNINSCKTEKSYFGFLDHSTKLLWNHGFNILKK